MSIEAMKQALEALDWAADHIEPRQPNNCDCPVCVASDALRLAIEQAEQQEPVCDKDPRGCWNVRCQLGKVCKNAAPPQRQPLTEAELNHLWETIYDHGNGKYEGRQSREQRERAFAILKRIGGGE